MDKLEQIKTMSLRDFIHQEMTKLHDEAIDILNSPSIDTFNAGTKALENVNKLIVFQEIAYRLEYGFITEIGNRSLKEHLEEPM